MTQTGEDRRHTPVSPPAEPLFGHSTDACTRCWGCVRHCPARAIRCVDGASWIIAERCVKCGSCVLECGSGAHPVRQDLPRVRELLASQTPVVALLSGEHVAALHPMTLPQATAALEALGFITVETTVLGEELVAAAYEQQHGRGRSGLPSLRSTCPVAVDWVRRFHPGLTQALVALVPPYIAQARLVRELYPGGVGIVYVSPCWARKDEVYDPAFLGEVDVAIGFDELRDLMAEVPDPDPLPKPLRRPRAIKQLSAIDGFPVRTLREANMTDRDIVTVRGLAELDDLLAAISRGETCPGVVDMLACDGCIDGPCVNTEMSLFAKRQIDYAERAREAPPVVDSRTFLSAIPAVELRRTFRPEPAPVREPTQEDLDRVLLEGEFLSRAETIDCGACGYGTCVGHAAAICLGDSTWEMCFPLTKKRLTRERQRLETEAVTDELTGLLNRRAFDRKLAEEFARAARYGTALSLVMMDLDRFKEVNDRHGHAAGDSLLRAMGVLLNSEMRESDAAVRYGGDEFALILPNTAKTDAWVVAEKVRSALATMVASTGDGPRVRATASVGVASFGTGVETAQDLLQAADGALYRAKLAGRDRVELAAG